VALVKCIVLLLFYYFTGPVFHHLKAPVSRVTAADVPLPYAKSLEDYALPQVTNVTRCVKRVLKLEKD
jgi:pyruvate dehydrogenase E1 component beta subunit